MSFKQKYVSKLNLEQIAFIQMELDNHLTHEGYTSEERKECLDNALNSRLADMENVIDIEQLKKVGNTLHLIEVRLVASGKDKWISLDNKRWEDKTIVYALVSNVTLSMLRELQMVLLRKSDRIIY